MNFYFTVLFADGMNAHLGDVMLQDSVALNENTTVGIDPIDKLEIQVSNLIGQKAVVVQTAGVTDKVSVNVTSLNGQEVYAGTITNSREIIDLSASNSGIYVVSVNGSHKSVQEKVLLLD